ncbi:hypothetical protein [uncultured Marivirga sp.]|uniref:hypothetical protein n=1 Tax=uncultured Marivirga sp. TaxID=1123707 RepID=UPI0030ED25E7
MNYKSTTIVLFLALVAMVIFHFYFEDNEIKQTESMEKAPKQMEEKATSANNKAIKEYFSKMLANGVDSTTGKFISQSKAKAKLDTMLAYRRNNPGKPGIQNAYGYIFGLEKMRGLIQRIDDINKEQDSVQLTGIRVYRTISEVKEQKYFDVFMIAVTKDNKDYPNLNNPDLPKLRISEDRDPILNYSNPCPTECN